MSQRASLHLNENGQHYDTAFCVLQFSTLRARERKNSAFNELSDFALTLDSTIAFESGPNRDFEKKSQDYSDGFIIRFKDSAALQTYAEHPSHIKLGTKLCALCVGGADGLMVFDIELAQASTSP